MTKRGVEEAVTFGCYFIKKEPSKQSIKVYQDAIGTTLTRVSLADKKLLDFGLKHPRSIGFIDSGLAITRSQSEFRRRLYLMFAILETSPDYANQFLPKKRNFFYIFFAFYVALRGLIKSLIGLCLVRIVA